MASAMIRCMGCMREYRERTPNGETVVCPHCGYVKNSPAKEAYHLPPGSILQGKYIVGKVLGYGGFGVTYIGYDAQLDRKIAIKEYFPTNFSTRMPGQTKLTIYDGEDGEQFLAGLKSFVEEARRLSKLNSLPGTVDIYDSFQQNDTGYIVMEFLDGKTVKEILAEKGLFQYEAAKAIILKILDTLKAVHKEGIIHRDIAPDNIFLLDEDDVRLIDFGASRYATTLHSKSLSVILKPGYAPEEQYRSCGNQGSWSDVYALAATFYKMITGITPEESVERMIKDDLTAPSKAGAKLPLNDENAIMNALLVKASDRTKSADEFERQLTTRDDVRRMNSTIKKYDSGRTPLWIKLLASCLIAIIVLLGTLLFTGVINLEEGAFVSAISGWIPLAENEVRIPELRNESYQEASTFSASDELNLIVTDSVFSEIVDSGITLTQEPLPGRIVLKQTVIEVTVSRGVETLIEEGIMPNVLFSTPSEAGIALKNAGIIYNIVYEESDTVLENTIIRQSPNPGERLADDEIALVTISDGSEKQRNLMGWGEWMEALPQGIGEAEGYNIATKTEYRSRDRETQTINSETAPSGWTLMERVRTGWHWSDWSGNWTWEETQASALYHTLTPTAQQDIYNDYAVNPEMRHIWAGRVPEYAYKYYRWTEWTEWTEIPAYQDEEDTDHEVEMRNLYRYRKQP